MSEESEESSNTRLEIQKIKVLRGPNVWANFPVIEAWVDLGSLADVPSTAVSGLYDRLRELLPSLVEHRCSIGKRGGFLQRLKEGTYPAHILEHLTLELHSLAGTPVGFGKARETTKPGVYRVIFKYVEEGFGCECLRSARELLLAAIDDRPFDIGEELDRLRDYAHRVFLGPSTSAIVNAAKARGIPCRRLNTNSLVQFGYGCRQRRIQAAETDQTGAIAEGIAQDKELTRQLLKGIGVPVPVGRAVDDAEDAWKAACEIGVPVVVKPMDGNQGRGVATDLSTEAQVRAAYETADEIGNGVIVEKFVRGQDYRVLVVGDRLVAAARREPAQVVGDGEHTVRELVEIVNRDPKRGEHHATVLSRIKIDDVALRVLESQGLMPESKPEPGRRVLIRRNANLSTGGTAEDITDLVHPEVAARAVEAAHMVGLDIAGIDVVVEDISRPLDEQGGVIVEVNAAPGLRMHLEPSEGKPRPVGEDIVNMLFPDGEDGRIPVVAVTGVNGKTTTTFAIGHILAGTGKVVGMTSTDGIFVGDRRIDTGDCSGPRSAGKILMHPDVEAAVLETARGGVIREGLGFDRCDVAVVTNIGVGDHLGLAEVETAEDLAKVKRCVVEVVSKKGFAVLNAADPLVAEMAEYCPGKVIFFALDGTHPLIVEHRAKGGRTAFSRSGMLVLAEGEMEYDLLPSASIPITVGGHVVFHVENMLAAAAAAWALGLPLDLVRDRLKMISGDINATRGRFSIVRLNGATVVVDYGHNVDSLHAVMKVLEKFPHTYRSAVYAAAGDRRDTDIIEQGEALATGFDRVFLYEDKSFQRGRADGEIISLLRRGLAGHGEVRTTEIVEIEGELNACELAVSRLRPGELLLMQIDGIERAIRWLSNLTAEKENPPSSLP